MVTIIPYPPMPYKPPTPVPLCTNYALASTLPVAPSAPVGLDILDCTEHLRPLFVMESIVPLAAAALFVDVGWKNGRLFSQAMRAVSPANTVAKTDLYII